MKFQRNLYLFIIIVCILILSTIAYKMLGGFGEIEVFEYGAKERTVVGVAYFGKHKDKKLDSIRAKTIADIQSNKLKGQLTIVDYHYDSRDSVKFFIGASFEELKNVIGLPSGYDYREFSTEKVYKVFITQNFFVRPIPEKVEEIVSTQAMVDSVSLAHYSFELYYEDGSLSVEYWGE